MMLDLMIFLLPILLFCTNQILDYLFKRKNDILTAFSCTFASYCLFIFFTQIIQINILTASKVFWIVLIILICLCLINLIINKKMVISKQDLAILAISLLLSVSFYIFSSNYMESVSLLPLSNVSDGFSTSVNYINNSLDINSLNYTTLYFTSFISLMPNSVSISTINMLVGSIMQFTTFYLLTSFYFEHIITNLHNTNNINLIATILTIPFLFGYEVFKLGYSNQIYLLIFTYPCIKSILLIKTPLIVKILLLLSIAFCFNLKTNGIIYIAFTLLIVLILKTDSKNKKSYLCFFILIITFLSLLFPLIRHTFNFSLILIPTQQAPFISYFNFSNRNIYVSLMIAILLFLTISTKEQLLKVLSIIFLIYSPLLHYYLNNNMMLLTSMQYLLFNPYTLNFFLKSLNSKEHIKDSLLYACIILSLYCLSYKSLENPYYEDINNFDKQLRISTDESEIYQYMCENVNFDNNLKIITQAPNTQLFIPNINVTYSYKSQMEKCQYCDVIDMDIHEPSKLANIFTYREFGGNRIFIENPLYESGCDLLQNESIDYLILRTDQTIELNGNWYTLYEYYSQCYSILYSNETYALLG